jgi:hypothetical protein
MENIANDIRKCMELNSHSKEIKMMITGPTNDTGKNIFLILNINFKQNFRTRNFKLCLRISRNFIFE